MNDKEIVVDASAVVALLKGEAFGDFDPAQIVGATISAVNFSEVLASLIADGLTEQQADEAAVTLNLNVVPFEQVHARVAAHLRAATRRFGLSLGDRACLALALALKAPVATADKIWSKLKIGAEIVLIR